MKQLRDITEGSFPVSRDQEIEMRIILNKMKERWKQNKLSSWYADVTDKKPDPKPPANKKEFVKVNEQYNVLPESQKVKGCRLCGIPTYQDWCSNECRKLDRKRVSFS